MRSSGHLSSGHTSVEGLVGLNLCEIRVLGKAWRFLLILSNRKLSLPVPAEVELALVRNPPHKGK